MSILPFLFRRSPAIPEMDFAGTIAECTSVMERENERGIKHGTQVFGSVPVSDHIKLGKGSLAEYVVVGHEYVVKKPEGIKMEEAAGLGVAGATALELMKGAKLKKGDSVLVNGASGGIGHFVTQMCREVVGETGKVVAVCSGGNVGWVKDLGCDEVSANAIYHCEREADEPRLSITKYIHLCMSTSQRGIRDLASTL